MKMIIDIPENIYDTIMDDQMLSREQQAILQQHIYNKHIIIQPQEIEITTMKLVIDVPIEWYVFLKSHEGNIRANANMKYDMCKGLESDIAILDGKTLPKGHGRLIDADSLARFIGYGNLNSPDAKMYSENDIRALVDNAPTIIEADKEGET